MFEPGVELSSLLVDTVDESDEINTFYESLEEGPLLWQSLNAAILIHIGGTPPPVIKEFPKNAANDIAAQSLYNRVKRTKRGYRFSWCIGSHNMGSLGALPSSDPKKIYLSYFKSKIEADESITREQSWTYSIKAADLPKIEALTAFYPYFLGATVVLSTAAPNGFRSISIFAEFEVSTAVAQYMTQEDNPENIRLSYLAEWLQNYVVGDVAGVSHNASYSVRSVSAIAEQNKQYKGRRKTKSDNDLYIDVQGQLVYLPRIDNSLQLESDIESYGMRDDGAYAYRDAHSHTNVTYDKTDFGDKVARKRPDNRLSYYDDVNDKFVYTGSEGTLKVYDMASCVPITDWVIQDYLDYPLAADSETAIMIKQAISVSLAETAVEKEPNSTPVDLYFDRLLKLKIIRDESIVGILESLPFGLLAAKSMTGLAPEVEDFVQRFSDPDYYTISNVYKHRKTFNVFDAALTSIEKCYDLYKKDPSAFAVKNSVVGLMERFAVIKLLAENVSKYEQVVASVKEQRKVYTNPKLDDNFVPVAPFVKDFAMLPHQVKDANLAKNAPPNMVRDIQAGGGKTVLNALDFMVLMEQGKVKRPLVICPANLIGNYIEDVNMMTGSRFNVIPITTGVLRNWGFEKLKQLIDSAPINTLVVTDYDFLRGGLESASYGNTMVEFSLNCEFMRQFDWDWVALDESQRIKNVHSQRNKYVKRLIAPIKYKRETTGTYIKDSLMDVVGQFSVMDPTAFYRESDFKAEYAAEASTNKVKRWLPGAEAKVRQEMGKYSTVVTIQRKEWAAILPPVDEEIYKAELSPAQRSVYEAVLQETIELLQEAMKTNAALKKALGKKDTTGDEDEDEDDADENLEALLNPYLARLEQYLTAPSQDELGAKLLKGDDLISPKQRIAYQIATKRLDVPGKQIMFTHYVKSSIDTYNNMPPALKSRYVCYNIGDKVANLEKFKTDPNIIGIIGSIGTLAEGHNLQMASSIIRLETVWNPGTLEQSQARINRPNVKSQEIRTRLYFDWILVDRSLDITKMSRLISKMVSAEKFNNPYDARYLSVESLDITPMSLDSIITNNSFGDTLGPHFDAYQSLQQFQQKDFDDYRIKNKDKLNPVKLKDGKVLPGSALLKKIPYYPSANLYSANELGLEKLSTWQQLNPTKSVKGLFVHTELGDGQVVGETENQITVVIEGAKERINKLSAFVINKKVTSSAAIKDKLAKISGLSIVNPLELKKKAQPTELKKVTPLVRKLDVKQDKPKKISDKRAPNPNQDVEENNMFNMYIGAINGITALSTDPEDPDVPDDYMKQLGFKHSGAYIYTDIRNPRQLRTLIDTLQSKFTINKAYSARLEELYEIFKSNKEHAKRTKAFSKTDVKNFFLMNFKPGEATDLKPYPMIEDDDFYLLVNKKGNPGWQKLKRIKIPGVVWEESDGEYWLFDKVGNLKKVVMEVKNAGHTIENYKDLIKDFSEYR